MCSVSKYLSSRLSILREQTWFYRWNYLISLKIWHCQNSLKYWNLPSSMINLLNHRSSTQPTAVLQTRRWCKTYLTYVSSHLHFLIPLRSSFASHVLNIRQKYCNILFHFDTADRQKAVSIFPIMWWEIFFSLKRGHVSNEDLILIRVIS